MNNTNATLKAVIFDVGGVLIRTQNRDGRKKWAARLGIDDWDFENFIFGGESGQQAQLGQKTFDEHWHTIGRQFDLSDTEVAAMRSDFFAGDAMNESLVAYVQRLHAAGYKTGILSNFADEARHVWRKVYPFIEYFDGIVISSEVGLMKPDPKIYHLAVESLDVAMPQALFVDDFIENIEGARQVGMQALHFTDPETAQQKLVEITGVP